MRKSVKLQVVGWVYMYKRYQLKSKLIIILFQSKQGWNPLVADINDKINKGFARVALRDKKPENIPATPVDWCLGLGVTLEACLSVSDNNYISAV